MNKNNLLLNLNNLPKYVILSLAFAMPLFFLPVTVEFFEFNKLALLIAGTLLLLVLSGIKILVTGRLNISKSSVDLPLVLMFAVIILSTIFSIHRVSSIYGSEGRWFPSLLGFSILFFFYYLLTSALNDERSIQNIVYALVLSITLNSLVSTLSYFKVYLGDQTFLKTQNFTLTGSTTTSILLAASAVIILTILLAYSKSMIFRPVFTAAALINFFYMALANYTQGWIILAVGILALLLMVPFDKIKENKYDMLILIGGVVATLIVILYPSSRQVIINSAYSQEVILPADESWKNSLSALRDFPILGSGPSTFYLNYPRYKSLQINNTSFWNIRFDKPYNELFNVLGTIGIVGLLASIFLISRVFKLAYHSDNETDDSGIEKTLSIGIIMSIVVFFVTYATLLNAFVFLLLVGLLVTKRNLKNEDAIEDVLISVASLTSTPTFSAVKKGYVQYIVATPLFLLAIFAGYFTYMMYVPEYYMKKALSAAQINNGGLTYNYELKAVNMNPRNDSYQSLFAQTNLLLANSLASNKNITDTDKQNIQVLLTQSIRSVRFITETLNPLNVADWETRAEVYKTLIGVADNADQWAINSYQTAIQLDPYNPRLRLFLGGIYYTKQDFLSAANNFKQATALKQDYANAYFNLAVSLVQLRDYDNAKAAFQVTQNLVSPGSQDAQIVAAELSRLEQIPAVAGAKTSKPSIEELSTSGNQKTAQEPISKPNANVTK